MQSHESHDGCTERRRSVRYRRPIGLIGGMGPLASQWMLERLLHLSAGGSDQAYPEILLFSNSSIPDRTDALLARGRPCQPELIRSVRILNEAGPGVAALCCMTAHAFREELAREYSGLLVDLPALTVAELRLQHRHCKRVGVIGSTGFLRGGILRTPLEAAGYEVIELAPEDQERLFTRSIYGSGGIKSGIVTAETRRAFSEQVARLRSAGADVVVGACSELPLVLQTAERYFDPFELLANELLRIAALGHGEFQQLMDGAL